jgi:predicted N-acetyltransferase YhbS
LQDLGNGLILRCAKKSDIKLLLEHVRVVFSENVVPIVRRFLKYYPDFPLEDVFVIFDTNSGKIVANLCLIRSTCVLNGTEFTVGHMGIVGTHPDFRNQGLIRQLNEVFEARVAEYDLPLVVIAGIPFYYRLFGYEYAISFGRTLPVPSESIPPLEKGEKEPVTITKVTAKSFQEYLKCREKGNTYLDFYRKLTQRDYSFLSKGKLGEEGTIILYIVEKGNHTVGSFNMIAAWGNIEIRELWLEDAQYIPSILRFTKQMTTKSGQLLHIQKPSKESLIPVLEQISGTTFGTAYAWYVRIPSIKHFLKTIKPVLEARLANSEFKGWTGTLRLSCYREGCTLIFSKGKLVDVKQLERKDIKDMDISIPPLVINQLLMGYRTFKELSMIYPDVIGRASKVPLVSVLFPKIRAYIRPEV